MNLLLTGATGFVGGHVADRLLARGDRLRVLARDAGRAARLKSLGAEICLGDLADEPSLQSACRGCDVVVHAAAHVEIVGARRDFHEITVLGTQRLFNAARAAGVKRFVHISSCGVYHPSLFTRRRSLDEFTPTPQPPHWFPYGRAKLEAEHLIRQSAATDIEWTILRLGAVYGPRNRALKLYIEPSMRDGTMAIIGDGQNPLALIFVGDVADAVERCTHVPAAAGQVLIACSAETITQQQYVDALADGLGVPRIIRRVPYAIAFAYTAMAECLMSKSNPRAAVLCRAGVAIVGLPQIIRCDHTWKTLDWKPRTAFADGMRETFDWYHQEYDAPRPACRT